MSIQIQQSCITSKIYHAPTNILYAEQVLHLWENHNVPTWEFPYSFIQLLPKGQKLASSKNLARLILAAKKKVSPIEKQLKKSCILLYFLEKMKYQYLQVCSQFATLKFKIQNEKKTNNKQEIHSEGSCFLKLNYTNWGGKNSTMMRFLKR